ncbi:hypothetical protein DOY81_000365 [Sarcophaga bullata]|nr:hypothetical protein DOY81_000365 [Sarcophaga bullata]
MIPTSVTGSPPPTAANLLAGSNNNGNGSGGSTNNSVLLGIASLILEGRAIAEDEYAVQTSYADISSAILSVNSGECGRQSPKPSTSRAAFGENYFSGASSSAFSIDLANYQTRKSSNSPELSTSLLRDYYGSSSDSASSSVESNHSRWSQKLSQLRQESPNAQQQGLAARQRIAVECPTGSEAEFVALAINTDKHSVTEEKRNVGDFDILRRMSINQMNFYNSPNSVNNSGSGGSSLNSIGGVGGGGSSENFMCSLQSLASNRCLGVGGNPLLANIKSPRYSYSKEVSISPRLSTSSLSQYHHHQQQHQRDTTPSSGSVIQSPLTTNACYTSSTSPNVGAGSGNNKEYLLRKTNTTQRMAIPCKNQASAKSPPTTNLNTARPLFHNLNSHIFRRETIQNSLNFSNATNVSNTAALAIANKNSSRNQTCPQQGPHCDQFLRKMGLAKGDALETEEHHCDMSYVNLTCTRWRAYCIKMENILARGEPICIEVYLGPVGHKVLLEQWIITQKEKQPPPTMTLPSLCSAIRSQLYFSQISAWCDLIKKSDKTIYETGRIIYTTPSTTSAAGDLATTTGTTHNPTSTIATGTSTTSTHNPTVTVTTTSLDGNGGGGGSATLSGGAVIVGCNKRRPSSPRLNIFYRIKQYDSTACFNSKPNVHNFPNVNITESCSVSVCLKSLPRITGGIPKVGTLTAQQQQQNSTPLLTANSQSPTEIVAVKSKTILATKVTLTPTNNVSATAMKTTTTINANKPTISIMNCDKNDNLNEHHQEQQRDKTFTSTLRCSYSSSCAINSNKIKPVSSPCYDTERNEDTDFGYGLNFDLSAGGDGCGFGGDIVVDCDGSNSSISTNNCGNLSHREKQLLKYRKRMMKRDKKQQQRKTNDISITHQMKTEPYDTINNMEEGHEYDDDHNQQQQQKCKNYVADVSEDCVKQSVSNAQRQLLPNNPNIINSIPSTNQQQQQQHHVKMISTGTQTVSNSCTSCGSEKSMICLKCNPLKSNTDADTTLAETTSSFAYEEMDAESSSSSSTASSLSSSDIIHTPRNKAELLLQAIQRTPKSNKKHKHKSKDSKDSNQMAAIKQKQPQLQPTPANNSNHARNSNTVRTLISAPAAPKNNSNSDMVVGCQLCKRQKTQHHFNSSSMIEDSNPDENNSSSIPNSSLNSSSSSSSSNIRDVNISNSSNNSKASTDCNDDDASSNDGEDKDIDGGKMLSSDSVDNVSYVMDVNSENEIAKVASTRSSDVYVVHETMEEEYFESSTKLTPHIDRCCLVAKLNYGTEKHRSTCSTPPLVQEQLINSFPIEDVSITAQFKTPSPREQQQNIGQGKKTQQPHKQTPKPNLLHIACNFNKNLDEPLMSKSTNVVMSTNITPSTHNPLLLRRSLPKVNLTPIFCNSSSMMAVANTSSPIPIANGVSNGSASSASVKSADINITEASPTFSFESPLSPASPLAVQKSNSAPTLPNSNSNSLSPRFVKASAIYKRRSRHLSDRSDRSSLCSDEQFSDEDVDSGMYSPFATSPVKLRTRLAAVFGHKPLLGNLEESLLQRRLVPKIEVMGFKLLLGASGGFCPTQLTIPAAAYFYELKGETLSTPYLCEIRLPRKGYTVPRCGTVQATLLNPMGMVVRMFVIPYDMRDMPSLHQTFIRQRILADTGMQDSITDDINQNVNSDIGDDNGLHNKSKSVTINTKQLPQYQQIQKSQQQRSPQCIHENPLGHFMSADNMKSLRYSIHLRFQTSRSGRLMLHTDIRLLISRRTDCDTAAAHAKGVLEAPNELITNTVMPTNPKYSARQDQTNSKI